MNRILWTCAVASMWVASSVSAATFTVDDLGDDADAVLGNGSCATAGGVCTLRAALGEAGASGGENTIEFALEVDDPVFLPESPLPTVTDTITLDGSTHPDGILVLGERVSEEEPALHITAEQASVLGMRFQGWAGPGIAHEPFNGQSARLTLTDVAVRDACGWGVRSVGTVEIAGLHVQGNGAGRGCEGGGVLGLRAVEGEGIIAENNGGPGVLSNQAVVLTGVSSQYNEGPGIRCSGTVKLTGTSRRDADNQITNNLGAGVVAGTVAELNSSLVSDNGGWGVSAERVILGTDANDIAETVLTRNGFEEECPVWTVDERGETTHGLEGCFGGGARAVVEATVTRAQSIGNNGPGVWGQGSIALHLVQLDGNEAGGVELAGDGSISITGDDNFVRDNYGRGLATGGKVTVQGSLIAIDNGGWGIWAGGDVVVEKGPDTPNRSRAEVVRNGLGDVCFSWRETASEGAATEINCRGGGILSQAGSIDIADANVGSNGGPGLWAFGDVNVARANLDENENAGARSESGTVRCDEGDLIVSNNYGDGIVAMGASAVVVDVSGARIYDNQGAGVHAVGGVRFGFGTGETVEIIRNGGGDECYDFADVNQPVGAESVCNAGGVASSAGAYASRLTSVTDNVGDGIRAQGPSPDATTRAHVSIEDGNVTGNTAFAVVTGGDMNFFRGSACDNGEGPFQVGGKVSVMDVLCGGADGADVNNGGVNNGGNNGGNNGTAEPDPEEIPDPVCGVATPAATRSFWTGWLLRR